MADFKENLDEEMEKIRSEGVQNAGEPKKIKKNIKFSFKTFSFGILACLVLTGSLAGWAWLKADETMGNIQESLPSKTTIVETASNNVAMTDIQTRLTMPGVTKPENAIETSIEEPKKIETPKPELPKSSSPIMESTSYGLLPKVDKKSGAKPYKVYKSSFTKSTQKPLLSFIVTDMGLSSKKTDEIIQNFSSEISFSFSPYSQNLDLQTDTAKKDGHEVWLTLPLETRQYPLNDPGPSTLLTNAGTEKNRARLHTLLGSTMGYVGFISPADHIFQSEDANVNPVIKEIFSRGLAVIDSNLSSRSFIGDLADRNDYPHAQISLWLDDDLSPLSLNKNMRQITQYGKNGKDTIVMLHPYPASLKAVQKFLNSKAADQFELAPASAQLINN